MEEREDFVISYTLSNGFIVYESINEKKYA